MAVKRDYYEILELSRTATETEIKAAYRKMAMKYHPDRNPGDKAAEDNFKEAAEAYEVLRDPQKRARYDRFGHEGVKGTPGGGFDFDMSDPFSIFEQVFGDMFGGRGQSRRGTRQQRGRDMQIRLKLSLEEVASGVERNIKIKKQVACHTCGGNGMKSGSKPQTCPVCQGAGEVREVTQSIFGRFMNVSTCSRCAGRGTIVSDPCETCRGEGRVQGEEMVEVTIPAGAADGNYLTLRGKGNAGPNGGPAGDLAVVIEEKSHPFFTRNGNDVIYESLLSFPRLALGGELEVPTLEMEGEENKIVQIQVPSGTQSGKVFRLRGKGFPQLNGYGRGDLLVQVKGWTPTKMSPREKEILEELAELENLQPPQKKGFFDKVKEALNI
ncbi:MAG: molecular chaperone DnaJ [Calditrichia bacterium]